MIHMVPHCKLFKYFKSLGLNLSHVSEEHTCVIPHPFPFLDFHEYLTLFKCFEHLHAKETKNQKCYVKTVNTGTSDIDLI